MYIMRRVQYHFSTQNRIKYRVFFIEEKTVPSFFILYYNTKKSFVKPFQYNIFDKMYHIIDILYLKHHLFHNFLIIRNFCIPHSF